MDVPRERLHEDAADELKAEEYRHLTEWQFLAPCPVCTAQKGIGMLINLLGGSVVTIHEVIRPAPGEQP
jgi:hypothetical protein